MTRPNDCTFLVSEIRLWRSNHHGFLSGAKQTVELKRIERDLKAAHKKWAGARRTALEQEEATAAVAHFHTGVGDPDSANTSQTAFV